MMLLFLLLFLSVKSVSTDRLLFLLCCSCSSTMLDQQNDVVDFDNVFLLKPFFQVEIARDLAHMSKKVKTCFILGELFLTKQIDNENSGFSMPFNTKLERGGEDV